MSKRMEEAYIVTASRGPRSRDMLAASALLLLTAAYTIQQNPVYQNIVGGFSISRIVDGARAPRQKAGIVREVTPATPVETAAQVDARIIQGFVDMQAEREAEARALAASPMHPMSAEYVHIPRWAAGSVTARNVQETYVTTEGEERTRTRVTGTITLPSRTSRAQ